LGVSEAESARLAKRMYLHLGVCVAELFRFGSRRGLEPTLRVEGEHHLLAAIAEGRGVLAVTGHLGNWELLARYGADLSAPLNIVTRRLSLGLFQGMWEVLREGGATLIGADAAGRPALAALKRGEIVGFVLDQHAPERSAVTVNFMGRPAATSTGLVRAARLTRAPIIPLFSWREGTTHVISIGAPISVDAELGRKEFIRVVTARCSDAVQAAVREHPEQWLWLHRRWKVPESLDSSEALELEALEAPCRETA